MKAGTLIRLPDGRDATVVYNGLDGRGVMFGHIAVNPEIISSSNPLFGDAPADYPYRAEAILRDPKLSKHFPGMECVGEDFEIVSVTSDPDTLS